MLLHRIVLAASALALGGCTVANEYAPPPPPKVVVAPPVTREVTTYVDRTGRLEARDYVEIRARVKGFLQTVEFEASDMVEAGQVLFTIEPESFEAARDRANAARMKAEADRDLAKATLMKAEEAFSKQAISEIEILQRRAELDAAEAIVAAAKAEVNDAERDLSYTQVKSPIAGRVSRELVDAGNLVGSNDNTLLTTVVSLDPVYAYFAVDERMLLEILSQHAGGERPTKSQTIHVLLELVDGSTYAHEGVVDFGDNRVDPATGTLQVRAIFPNPDFNLYPGLFARVRIPKWSGTATLVPRTVVQRDLVGSYVLVVDASNTVFRRDVTLGDVVGLDRIVTDGLEPDDRIIVNGIQRARAGITVDVETAPPAPDETGMAPPASTGDEDGS